LSLNETNINYNSVPNINTPINNTLASGKSNDKFKPTRFCRKFSSSINLNNLSQENIQRDLEKINQVNGINKNINSNLLFLECDISDIKLRGLVDSGASHCYMGQHTFDEMLEYVN